MGGRQFNRTYFHFTPDKKENEREGFFLKLKLFSSMVVFTVFLEKFRIFE